MLKHVILEFEKVRIEELEGLVNALREKATTRALGLIIETPEQQCENGKLTVRARIKAKQGTDLDALMTALATLPKIEL